jgi:Uma2 family endonuclease
VIELRSVTDNLKLLQEKMREYQRLGVRLGLLINPQNQPLGATHAEETSARLHPQVEIYRSGQEPEILEAPTEIDCGDVMSGFVLSMSRIW